MAFEISMGRLREAFAEYTNATGSSDYRGDVEKYLASEVYESHEGMIRALLENLLTHFELETLPDTELIDVADGLMWFGFYGDGQDFLSLLIDTDSFYAEDILDCFNGTWDDLNEDYETMSWDIEGFTSDDDWWKSDEEDFSHIKILVEPALNSMVDHSYTEWIQEYCPYAGFDYAGFDTMVEKVRYIADAVLGERLELEEYYVTPEGSEHKDRLVALGLDHLNGLGDLSYTDFGINQDGDLVFVNNEDVYRRILGENEKHKQNSVGNGMSR